MLTSFCKNISDIPMVSMEDLATLIVSSPMFTVDEFLSVDKEKVISKIKVSNSYITIKDFIRLVDASDITEVEKAAIATVMYLNYFDYPAMIFYKQLEESEQ